MYATVQELVDALTLEEKAGLCTGAAVPRLGLPALRVNGLHSQESAGGVCFPSACAAAASFDPEVARRMGAALGREARSGGAQLLDVPDVNLKRGPLSGRSADTWGEDPCLTGALAAAFLQGVQSAGVGGCAGRLAVVNQETDRRTLNRRVDERTLQELYLSAFETAVRDGQPRAVVCSAGLLNGTRICEDTALLTDTLRGAWGFAGAVLAEPGAVQDPARTLAAGVDFAPADAGRLVDAVQSGALDESVLNRAASNIIRTLLAASTQPSPADRDRTADRSLAVELAKQSRELLRTAAAQGAEGSLHRRLRRPPALFRRSSPCAAGHKCHRRCGPAWPQDPLYRGLPRGPRPARRGGVPRHPRRPGRARRRHLGQGAAGRLGVQPCRGAVQEG